MCCPCGAVRITDLDFADDGVIFADTAEVLAEALETLCEEAEPLASKGMWPYLRDMGMRAWRPLRRQLDGG